jgi:circadian clock protein KaiC
MGEQTRVKINQLATGVPGLDEILGGGIPEFSFNIIAGSPGCGKTTLAHQFIFANATRERPALYFTVMGEPALKMLRYQQQFTFFDAAKLNNAVRFINLSQDLIERGLQGVLEEISKHVQAANPSIVVVDSFRTVLRSEMHEGKEMAVQTFVQHLALMLARRPAS